jgi:hypothetical protein
MQSKKKEPDDTLAEAKLEMSQQVFFCKKTNKKNITKQSQI